jgi:uncharacterized protein
MPRGGALPEDAPPGALTARARLTTIVTMAHMRQCCLVPVLALTLLAAPRVAADAPLRLTTHRVPWPVKNRVRVVQLSDLHVGRVTPALRLQEVLTLTRQAKPDFVVLTGDYVNRSLAQLPALRQLVAALPRPCLAVLGNHDYWSGGAAVAAALRRAGAQVLINSSTVVAGTGWEVIVVGIDDPYTGHQSVRQAFARAARPREALVLTHYPDIAPTVARFGGRLILSGHTHGGHLNVPLVTRTVARALGHRFLAGWYDLGAARLYVNVGIGSAKIRVRTGKAAPEVAVFDLEPSP